MSCVGGLDAGPTKRIKVQTADESIAERTLGKSTFMSTDCDDLLNLSCALN